MVPPPDHGQCLVNGILGNDELGRIFDALPPSDLAGGAALVCKQWCGSTEV